MNFLGFENLNTCKNKIMVFEISVAADKARIAPMNGIDKKKTLVA